MLIKFSFIQTFFFLCDSILLVAGLKEDCSHDYESRPECVALNLGVLISYQLWAWYCIYFNWKMVSQEIERSGESLLNTVNSSQSSSLYVPDVDHC